MIFHSNIVSHFNFGGIKSPHTENEKYFDMFLLWIGFCLFLNQFFKKKNASMIKILPFIFISLFSFQAFSQDQIKPGEIQNSDRYLWGTGTGNTYRMADNNALDQLISQINVRVESYFEGKTTEVEGTVQEFAELVVKTYSNVNLVSAKSLLISERRGKFEVMRYISLSDLNQLFENRKSKIMAYVKSGLIAESDLRIGDALKNYYWALVLLQSHKDRDQIFYDFPESGPQLLSAALPEKINNVFSDLEFKIKSMGYNAAEKYKVIHLDITYNGAPVENLDYSYWRGSEYSNLVNTRSGLGIAEFYGDAGNGLKDLKILVEYEYAGKTSYDLEVNAVFDNISLPYFDRSEFIIPIPNQEKPDEKVEIETRKITFEKLNKIEQSAKLRKKMMKVVDAIQSGEPDAVASLFTADGLAMYQLLIASGNPMVLPFDDSLKLIELEGETMVRSVPMRFSYRNNTRDFIEQVVFTFNGDQKIEAVSFALGDKAIDDIVNRSMRFGSVEDKYQLINFLEHYKTAYCLKRLDYIESIFADNALIIVGHVVKTAEPIDGMYAKAGHENVEFIELSKSEYLDRLRNVFQSNEFVNIHFEENIVKKVNGDSKIYGIQIMQDYFSSTYADKGYLFLMIDLNDSLNPKIYVRTWQPERNPDGSIFGLDDFFVN